MYCENLLDKKKVSSFNEKKENQNKKKLYEKFGNFSQI